MPSHTLHPQSTNFRACGNLRKSTDHNDLFDTNFQLHNSNLQISTSFTHSGQGSSERGFFLSKLNDPDPPFFLARIKMRGHLWNMQILICVSHVDKLHGGQK